MIHKLGHVCSYFPERKFGWIEDQEDGSTIFFHADNYWDASADEIELGEYVLYMPAISRRDGKPFAREIRIVSPELIESLGTSTRFYGYVVAPIQDRGIGYISPTNSKARLFFHRTSVVDREKLETGQPVSFKVKEDGKGLAAFEITAEVEQEDPQDSQDSKEVSASTAG